MTAAVPRWLDRAAFDQTVVRATSWLQEWDSQGPHRTGTAGDAAGAEWLAQQATALGAVAGAETFALDRLDPLTTCLEFEDQKIQAEPIFDAAATGPAGLTGRLGAVGSGAAIVVTELAPQAVYPGEFRALCESGAHAALVVITKGPLPGLALLNAEQFRTPYGAPAIQVSSEAGSLIQAAVRRGATACLTATSRRVPAQASNVLVHLHGDAAGPPLVVMTPRSSWWQSTAERGGGIVCWLEALRALLANPPARDVVFTANSGHELGHLGLDDFVARRQGWDRSPVEGGAVWVHYGANIGAAGGRLSLISNDDAMRSAAQAALAEAQQPPDHLPPTTLVPSGETRDIHRAGGRYLTLVGSNAWFHMPQDRWPHTVDILAISRIAAAGAKLVAQLAS